MLQISNLLNCKLRSFLIIVFSMGISLGSLIILNIFSFDFPILRQILGFIYLTFIPGIVLLRLFKLKIKLPEIEVFMYTIGLSVAFIMFVGFFINKLTWFNFSSLSSLVYMSIFFFILSGLCILCYIFEKQEYSDSLVLNYKCLLSPAFPFLILIFFTAVNGAWLLNYYHCNILLILFVFLVILTVFFIISDKFIPKNLYPFAIFVIAISILYHNSLSSTYLDGYDIHSEYYFANLVKLSGIWNSNINANVNAMLSIVALAPIYSRICNMELTWVFKIIYPFFLSLIPLGTYHIYNKQINNDTISFLSVFYIISVITYFTEMLSLARQQIAEFFFILIIMLMISDLELLRKRLLFILFSMALVTSHYGISYLMLVFSIPGYLFMVYVLKQRSDTFRPNFALIFLISIFTWYSLITSGSVFETIVHLFSNMYSTFMESFLNSKAASLVTSNSLYLSDQILKILYLMSQFFIVVGFVKVYLNKNQYRFSSEYLAFSFICLLILISSIITPMTGMNIHRLYHITSLLLSLFYVIGIVSLLQLLRNIHGASRDNIKIINFIKQLIQSRCPPEHLKKNLRIVAVFLIGFMLFNIGIPQQIIKDHPTSHSINRELILNSENNTLKDEFYTTYFPEQDITGTRWLAHNRNRNLEIDADIISVNVLFWSYGMMPSEKILTNKVNTTYPSYIYLRYPNVNYGIIKGPILRSSWKLNDISETLAKRNLIYSSKDNLIYK